MNFSGPFIRRPVMTTLLMAGILIFGLIAFWQLPISDLPDIASPTITVTANNPGSDPQTMAANVATPLEKQLMSIQGLKMIFSQSSYGTTKIVLQFELNKSVDTAATDVTAAINRALGNLPPEMPTQPSYQKVNPSDSPVIYVAVSSETMTLPELYDYASTAVSQRFSMLEGVSQVQVYGSKRAVRVKLNPEALAAMNLGIDQVVKSVVDANQSLPGGKVYDERMAYTVLPMGQMKSGASYNRLIVAQREGAPVYLSDIGHAIDGAQTEDFYLNFWSRESKEMPTVIVAVTKESGYNTVELCNQIHTLLPLIGDQLPESLQLSVIYDSSVSIKESIDDVEFTLVLAFCLVVFVIFFFLGNMRTTIIPAIALPMAVVGTFGIMYVNNYSIDILSMLALILVVGFLVDDAIVVLENIVRHKEMGKSSLQASLDGSQQISSTVLSMSLALSAVFIPFIFMPGMIGRMFHEFAMVVVIAVLFSGAVSLTLTPMLCSRFLPEKRKEGRFEQIANAIVGRLLGWYEPCLSWVLKHRFVPIGLASVTLIVALYLFKVIPQDFLPPGDTGAIQGLTVTSEGVSYDEMIRKQERAQRLIQQHDAVKSIISIANIPSTTLPNQGILYISLDDSKKRAPIDQVARELSEKLGELAGLRVFLRPIPEIDFNVGTGVERADYSYYLSTLDNPDKLYEQTELFTKKLQEIPELTNVSSNVQNHQPQLTVNILRDQASSFGITVKEIEQALSWSYGGGRVSTYKTPIDIYNIVVEMENQYKKNPNALDFIYLTPSGSQANSKLVPLRSVANWETTVGPVAVYHINQFTSSILYFNLAKNAALSSAMEKVDQAAASVFPPDVMRHFRGQAQVFQETMKSVSILMFLGILVIYLLLGCLYESFIHPLTILSTLPGALFGGLFMLVLFQETLSLYAYIGMVVLIGIVLKNGIMLVEFANEQVTLGKSSLDAIQEACRERFRPILMTTVAASMGAVPIALGMGADASSRRSLGLIILGGLFFAQLITYFFTPVVYLFAEWVQQKLKN